MKIDEFVIQCKEWCNKTRNDSVSVGKDMHVNTKVTVDEDGVIWIRVYDTFKRIKTAVNVCNIIEFRLDDWNDGCFYIICSDDTGFEVCDEEIYYCVDGRPNGWGNVEEYFKRFPDGI